MMDWLIAFMHSMAVLFLAWGAYLCLFCRDRRTGPRTTAGDRRDRASRAATPATFVDLASAAKGRATDFEIGFRRRRAPDKLAI